ncbi:variable large family protein [Borreliella burgdorferi]|uniref:variable large family protein n=3 Tax=Borreliella burgdorferi TaxID=139 RepID=UPI000D047850|nr:variable large family protein [Borreliella burgdorferi]PRR16170.1 outer surface protein VlsE [Borreliella burgdorferi]
MKKISSAIFMVAFFAFINCKSNVGESSNTKDPTNEFYQSVIKLGNGFLDVFTSFGGLVADAFGLKADPKKSEVKTYFSSIAKKLEDTVNNLAKLPKDNGSSTNQTEKGNTTSSSESAVEKAIEEISKKLKAIAEAAKAAAAVDGSEEKIGNVAANNNAAADKDSVNGIAKGMKGIVDAADGGKELKGGDAGGAAANGDAGHLFAGNGVNGADAAQAGKAAAAVNAVSGEQILKAIVDAAGDEQQGAAANTANNPISAAIGTAQAGADFAGGMNGNDKIAAAIVLRGMAKDGKFAVQGANADEDSVKSAVASGGAADAGSVNGIAKGMKGIVDAADGGKELKGGDAGGAGNGDAGHLFAGCWCYC